MAARYLARWQGIANSVRLGCHQPPDQYVPTEYLYKNTLNVIPGIVGDAIDQIDLNVMTRIPVLQTNHLFINEKPGIVADC